jgi:ubiquinone/menaquinone biosynthesis C-methylase UbiE
MSQTDHFDAVAARYDDLRSAGDFTGLHTALVEVGALAGTRLLDIGCGTGAHLLVFRDTSGCDVAGIDASPRMLAQARAKLPDADLREGLAEDLPFADGVFDAALMMLVVQHLGRPRAFAEARRVLADGGRLIVHTPNPDGFERGWLAPFLPSYVEVERARFPGEDQLGEELRGAGFSGVSTTHLRVPRSWSRDYAVERIRGRYASTFDLLPPDEYEAGLARAERELPDPVEYTLESLVVRADR